MKQIWRSLAGVFVVAVFAVGHAIGAPAPKGLAADAAVPASSQAPPQRPLQLADAVVSFKDNRFIVRMRSVPLGKVLEMITKETGVAFFLKGSAETPVTADIESMDLDKGIKRLIRGLNSVFYYGPSKPGTQEIQLTSVFIISNIKPSVNTNTMRSTGAEPFAPWPPERSSAMPHENPVEDIDRLYEEALNDNGAIYEIALLAEFEENQEKRLAAVETLGDFGNLEFQDTLIEAMKDNDYEVRAAAVEALGSVSGKQATDYLLHALEDENADVRTVAIETLGSVGGENVVTALIKALKDEDTQVRIAAVEALADIGDENVAPALFEALDDSDEEVRDYAKEALEEMGIQKSSPEKP